jgi:ABC-2 type transport system permease protein
MKKIWLVFLREYLTRVQKRTFIITTLLVPLGIVLLLAVQVILIAYSNTSLRIAVKDDSRLFLSAFKDEKTLHFIPTIDDTARLKKTYREQNFDGILYIPNIDLQNPNGFQYISDKVLGMSAKSHIEREIKDEIKQLRLEKLGVDRVTFNQAGSVDINVHETISDEKGSTGLATMIGFGMGMLMYLVIFIYGMMVMRGVAEEKTSRIVEVVLSSVEPFKLMMGKILGIGAVGLTQTLIWIVFSSLLNLFFGAFATGFLMKQSPALPATSGGNNVDIDQMTALAENISTQVTSLPWGLLLPGFLFYFIMGYILYAAMFAALGAAIDDESDNQTLTLPVSLPVIVSVFILSAAMENPNMPLLWWASFVPLCSPILMPFRMAFGVPWYELLISMALLTLGALATVWLAAKIYRTGILLYGKKTSFREIAKWAIRA